ncbi:unnamed protein product [Miscanthus lutarioriparius]|uniref:Uncharacterized protein n=1 Tax=Miscanthus lutarioriparius TaxID=422564 RepID=A0A811NNY7_9POAL|nr:unnamed protein product [Miscanthus lutarioriparius]
MEMALAAADQEMAVATAEVVAAEAQAQVAGDQEIGESIFVEEEQEDANWGDPELTPPTAPLEPTMSTLAHSPDSSSSTTLGPLEQPPQPTLATPKEALVVVEGEATSLREAP